MTNGFTDDRGRFRPTGNRSRVSSREKTIDTEPFKIDILPISISQGDLIRMQRDAGVRG